VREMFKRHNLLHLEERVDGYVQSLDEENSP
jgi:hypothetical protein